MVSSLGNLNELDLNKIWNTEGNIASAPASASASDFNYNLNKKEDNYNDYSKEQRLLLTKSAKNLFKDKNESKLRKFVDQSSHIFPNDLYGNNLNITLPQQPKEILKIKLIPTDKKANLKNLSNEELKSAFAKKGYFILFMFYYIFIYFFLIYYNINIVFMLLI